MAVASGHCGCGAKSHTSPAVKAVVLLQAPRCWWKRAAAFISCLGSPLKHLLGHRGKGCRSCRVLALIQEGCSQLGRVYL